MGDIRVLRSWEWRSECELRSLRVYLMLWGDDNCIAKLFIKNVHAHLIANAELTWLLVFYPNPDQRQIIVLFEQIEIMMIMTSLCTSITEFENSGQTELFIWHYSPGIIDLICRTFLWCNCMRSTLITKRMNEYICSILEKFKHRQMFRFLKIPQLRTFRNQKRDM